MCMLQAECYLKVPVQYFNRLLLEAQLEDSFGMSVLAPLFENCYSSVIALSA